MERRIKPEITVDIKLAGVESAVVYAPFDEAQEALTSRGYKIISLPRNTHLRIQQGRDSFVSKVGGYAVHGFVYAKNALPLVARISPLVKDNDLARRAVEAHRKGERFVADRRDIYEQHLSMAEEDKAKEPIERRVLVLPSRKEFFVSPTENPETFYGLFGNVGEEYLRFAGHDKIVVYPTGPRIVDSSDGTLLTQLWFRPLDFGSGLVGYDRLLDGGDGLRGVKELEETGGAR